MKDYLSKFQSAAIREGGSFGNAPGMKPTKPTKPGFVGFVGLSGSAFPKVFLPDRSPLSEFCPTCGGATQSENGDGWRHRWCPEAGHFDWWSRGGLGAYRNHAARQKLEACLARHECPECGEAMTLQCREPETYYCPGCQLWVVEGMIG